jgi:O-antigen ligase
LPVRVLAAGFFIAEIVVLPGAASPFRLPKEAVALAAICAAVALALAAAARRRSIAFPEGAAVWTLLALPLLQACSAAWSASPARSLETAAASAIWVLAIAWLATLDEGSRRLIGAAAVAGVVISAAVMLMQLTGVEVFRLAAPFASARLSLTGLTGNPADLAMAAALLLPPLLVWGESRGSRALARGLAVFLALVVLLTQTLTGAAAVFAIAAVWLARQRSRRLWLATAAIGVLVVGAALGLGLGERLYREAQRVAAGDWYGLLSARGDGWTAALQMVAERPLGGVGAGHYTVEYYPSRLAWLEREGGTGGRAELASHFEWAHCDPLQVVAELGLGGAAWMLAFAWVVIRTRGRADPQLPLTAAVAAPFLLLHYPAHLAVGLIPIALALGGAVAGAGTPRVLTLRRGRVPLAVALIAALAAGAWWQARRVAADTWIGGLELRMALSQSTPREARAKLGAAVEAQVLDRIERLPLAAPALWRTVGRARLLADNPVGAEAAFRTAWALWPHEDAELYLGISLAAQGRRNEALSHLGRVCRTNPRLVKLIADENLRRAVEDMLEVYRRQ